MKSDIYRYIFSTESFLRNVCELSVILAVMLPAERDRQFRVISVSCQRGNSRPGSSLGTLAGWAAVVM